MHACTPCCCPQPPFFGGTNDGPGHSIVYYFALPEDFDPHAQPNPKAMGLLRRFVNGGREADGTPTRDRWVGGWVCGGGGARELLQFRWGAVPMTNS